MVKVRKTRGVLYSSPSPSPPREQLAKKEAMSSRKTRKQKARVSSESSGNESPSRPGPSNRHPLPVAHSLKVDKPKPFFIETPEKSRRRYTAEDQRAMLEYLHGCVTNKSYKMPIMGKQIWDRAQRKHVTPHTAQSMMAHFKRQLLPVLGQLDENIVSEDHSKAILDELVQQGIIKKLNVPVKKRVTDGELAEITEKAKKYKKVVQDAVERRKKGETGFTLDVSATQNPLVLDENSEVSDDDDNVHDKSVQQKRHGQKNRGRPLSASPPPIGKKLRTDMKPPSKGHIKEKQKRKKEKVDAIELHVLRLPTDMQPPDVTSERFKTALFDAMNSEEYKDSKIDIASFMKTTEFLVKKSEMPGTAFRKCLLAAHTNGKI